MQADITCKNCGHRFIGNYCNECGEKVYTDHDKSFRHFLEESFHFLTHFNNKIFRTWWLVMTRPGFVSTQIVSGVRKPYYKPANLFIIGVILYLLFPFFQGLNMPMRDHLNEIHRKAAESMIVVKMRSKNLTFDQVAEKFDQHSPKVAKLLLLIIIPLGGLALQLLFKGRSRFYFDHITLAAELSTFYLFFTFFIIPLAYTILALVTRLFAGTGNLGIDDSVTLPLYAIVFGTYCAFAFRRFYHEKKGWAILKSALFLIFHGLIVYVIYRFILFAWCYYLFENVD